MTQLGFPAVPAVQSRAITPQPSYQIIPQEHSYSNLRWLKADSIFSNNSFKIKEGNKEKINMFSQIRFE